MFFKVNLLFLPRYSSPIPPRHSLLQLKIPCHITTANIARHWKAESLGTSGLAEGQADEVGPRASSLPHTYLGTVHH